MLLSEIVAGARQNPNLNRSYLPSSAYARADKYKVRSGDSLGKIAAELGISPEELSELNELSSPNLNIGDELVTSAEGQTTIIDQVIQAKELGAPLSQLEGVLSPEALAFARQIYAAGATDTTEVPEQETQVEATPTTGITPEQPTTAEPIPNVLDANLEAVEADGIYATGLSHDEMAEVAARNSEQEAEFAAWEAAGITSEDLEQYQQENNNNAGKAFNDFRADQQKIDRAAEQEAEFAAWEAAGITSEDLEQYRQQADDAAYFEERRKAFTSPTRASYKRGSNNTFAQIAHGVEAFFEMVRHENTASPEESTLLLRKLTAIVGKNIQGSPDETVRTVADIKAEIQTTPPKQTKPAHWTDSIIDGASDLADIYEREAAKYPAQVQSYKEVLDDPSKAPTYILEAVVENLPNMAVTAAGGVFGVPGMLAASASVLTGEYYKGMVDEGVAPHKAGATAIAMAIPGAMLEVGSFANMLQAAFKGSTKPPETILALVGTVLDRVVGAGLFESGTEQIQTMLGFIGTKLNKPEYEILSRKNLEELAEASVKAFAAGGGTTAPGASITQTYAYGGEKLKQTRVGKERVSKEAEIKLQDAIKNTAPDDDSMGWARDVKAYVTAKQAELVGNTELYEQFNEVMVDFDARAMEALERATTYTEKTKTLHRIGDAYFAIVDYYGKDSKKDAAKVTAALNRVLGPVGTTETPPTKAYAADVALNDKDVESRVEQMLTQLRRIKTIKETGDLTAEQQKTIDLAKKAVEKLGGELRAGGISTEDVKARLVAMGEATATPTQASTDTVVEEVVKEPAVEKTKKKAEIGDLSSYTDAELKSLGVEMVDDSDDSFSEDDVNALLGELDAANEAADVPQVDVATEGKKKTSKPKPKKYENSGEQDLAREFALAQEQEEQTLIAQLEYDARKRIDMSSTYGEHYGPDLDLGSLPWAERLEANNGNWKQMMSLMSSADRQEAEQDKSFLEALEASGLSAKDMISRYDTQYDSSGEQHVNDPAEAQGSAKASLSAPLLIGKGDLIHDGQMPYARAAEDGSTTDATKKRLKAVEKAYPGNDAEIVSAYDTDGTQYDYIAVYPSDTNDLSGVVFETEMHLRKTRTEGNKKANSDSAEQKKDLIYIEKLPYDTIEITKLGLLKLAIGRDTDYIRQPNAADIYEAYWLGAEALIDAVDSNGEPLHSSLQKNGLKSGDLVMTDEATGSPVIWRYKQSNVAGRPGQLDLTLLPTTIESGEKAYAKANNNDTSINDTVEKAVGVTDKNRAEVMARLRKKIATLKYEVERLENPAKAQRSKDNAVLELIGHLKDALHALNPIQKQKRQLTQLRKLADSLSNKFDINNATVEELSAFQGVGAKTAEAIRAYLQDNPISDIGQLVGKVARVTSTLVDRVANGALLSGKILTPKERTQLEEIPHKIAELEALIKKPKQLNDWELARFKKLDEELDRLGMQGEAPMYSKATVASTETLEQEFSKLAGSLPTEEVSIDAARKDFKDVTPESLRIHIPAYNEPSAVYNEDSGRQEAISPADDDRGAAKQINALVDTLQKQLDMLNDPTARADKGFDKLYDEAFKRYSVIRTATTMFQLDMYTRRESLREAAYDQLADLYAISLTDKMGKDYEPIADLYAVSRVGTPSMTEVESNKAVSAKDRLRRLEEHGTLSEAEARRVRRIEAKDQYPLSAMDRAVSTNLEELANYAKALTNHGFLELAAEANAKLKALEKALHTVEDNERNGYVPVGGDSNDSTAYDNKVAREGQKFKQSSAATDKLWRSNSNTSGGRVVQNAFSAITSQLIKLRNRRTPGDNIVNLGSRALGGLGKELAQIMLGTKSNFKVVLLDDAGIESLKAHNTIELPQFPLELMDADGSPVFTQAEIDELGSPYKSVVAALQGSAKALETQLKAMGTLDAKSFADMGKYKEAVAIQDRLKGIQTAIHNSVEYMTKADVTELADTRKTMLLLDKLRNDGAHPAVIDAHLETLKGVPRIEIVKKFEAHKKIVNPLYDAWTMEQLESRLPGGINEGTPGTTIYHKDHAIIYVDTKESSNKMEHRITLGHEFGHAFMGAAFAEAPKEIQEALVGAYESDPNAPTSIREWYADQMVAWLSDPDHIDKILNYKRNAATEKGVQSLADTLFEADLVENKGALVTREVAVKQQAARQEKLSEARKELHLKVGRLFQSVKDGWARVHAWASKKSNLTPLNETFTEFMESVTSGVFDGGSTFNLDEGRLDNIAPIDMDPNPPTEEELTGFAADLGDTFTFAITPNRRNRARAHAHRVLENRGAGLRATLLSADQQLRMVGASAIANKLWLRPQTTAAKLPWINAVDQRSRQWGGQYEAVTAGLSAAQRLSAFQQMQNEQLSDEQITAQENDPQVAEATRKLRKVHKEFGRYLEVAIPGFTSVANHFPRAYNTSRLETEAPAFIQFLVDEMGVSPERADILRRTILNEGETALSLNPATASGSTRERTITVDNATLLGGGWLHPDPQYALMSSVRKSIRHAELGRLFGGMQLDQAGNEYFDPSLEIQQVLGGLPTATARNRARVIIEGILGQRGLSMDSTLRKYQNNIMAVQNWLTLLYTAVASPPELAGPILRAKDLGGATKALHSFIRTVKDHKEAYKRYGAMGFLEETLAHQAMSAVYGLDAKPSWASTTNKNLFFLNGQQWFTNMSRVMSASVAEDFILRHGVTAPDGHSESYLEELKLTPAIVARWDALGRPIWNSEEQFSESSLLAQKVQDAIGIFVDQSIVNPNNAIKPVFMSDARFALVSHLKTFYYSFQHTVLEGLWNNMKQKDGVTAKAVPAVLAAFTLMPLSGLSLETRELLQYWGQKDPTANDDVDEYLWNLFRRAGGLGALELGMSALDAQGWNGSALTRLAGPTAGHIEAILNAPDSGRGISSAIPVVRQMPALKQLLFDND